MSRIRFRLRTALVLMVVACVPLGITASFLRSVRMQQQAVAELKSLGYTVAYSWDDSSGGHPLGQLLGKDATEAVIEVRLATTPSLLGDNTLERARPSLALLPSLRRLDLSYSTLSDGGLETLAGLSRLEELNLTNCKYVALETSALEKLPALRRLNLSRTQVGDDAVARLTELGQLEELNLCYTPMSNAGVAQLRETYQSRCRVLSMLHR